MAIGALSLALAVPARAQTYPRKVTVGEPSVWSLEQAHYLLGRIHAANDGLRSRLPDAQDLDPNAANARRIEVLRTMLGVAAEFDETVGIENRQALNDHRAAVARRTELRSRLDQLRAQRVEAVSRLGRLRVERELLNADSAATDADKRLKDAEIAAATAEKEALDGEITSLQTELAAISSTLNLTATSPAFEGDSGLAPAPTPALTQELVSQALTAAGNASPKLHVSTVLDNHVQMQYELLAKQLTLLRDELGPDRRLLFLELPVSIYTQPRHDKKRVAQVRWKVLEICRKDKIEAHLQKAQQDRTKKLEASQQAEMQRLGHRYGVSPECKKDPGLCKPPEEPPTTEDVLNACRDQWDKVIANTWESPRVVDVIPRRSALNVNQVYNETRGLSLGAKFAGAFGLGAAARYQRQRELFEQYMHQDVFASGFGKGEGEFGWSFGPEPGTKLVAPGVRTTHAALVIPQDVKALRLDGTTFLYKNKELPDLTKPLDQRTAEIVVPATEEGFYVSEIDYAPVAPGERITVFFEGSRDFSPQIGVLVNGVPLRRAVAIARSGFGEFAVAPAVVGTGIEVSGEYELVNSRRLVLCFSMGERFAGTPVITLVTPTKATSVNTYQVTINGDPMQTSLHFRSQVEPMFMPRLAVTALEPIPPQGGFDALLVGHGFQPGARIFIDGVRVRSVQQVSTKVYRLGLGAANVGNASEVEIRIRQRVRQGSEEVAVRLPNPRVPRLVRSEILSCGAVGAQRCGTMTAKLELSGGTGAGINVVLESGGTGSAVRLSDTERLLRLASVTDDVVVLRLVDGTLQSAATLVVPEPPTVRSIAAAPTLAAKGPSAGSYLVSLQGRSLERVTRVLFGDRPAPIQRAGPGEVVVIAPAGTNKTTVPVRVATDVVFLGRVLDNERDFNGTSGPSFSYEDPPPPKPAS